MTKYVKITTAFLCLVSLPDASFATINQTYCEVSTKSMHSIVKDQISRIKEYDDCLKRENAVDISSNYIGFVCDFQARQTQRGQTRLSLAALDAHRACASNEAIPDITSSLSKPKSILPQGFVLQTVAKRAPAIRGER
jgi:hypothetical protein